jgi:mitochondrial fission protein ELM1
MKVWALLGAHQGDNNQVLAIAEGLGLEYDCKQLTYNFWRHLRPRLLGSTLLSLSKKSRDDAKSDLPDLTISAGHRSVPVVRALRKRSGGRLRSIHVGYPRISPGHFDLVVSTPEYPIADHPNLLRIPFAITRGPDREARDDPFWSGFPSPRTLIVVGGPTLYWRLDPPEILKTIDRSLACAASSGGSVLVVGSPRTPESLLRQIEAPLRKARVPATLVPAQGPPSYGALLAMADSIFVTADSVAMVSDAIATRKPISLVSVRPTSAGRAFMNVMDWVRPGRRVHPRDLRFFWRELEENRLVGPDCKPRQKSELDIPALVAARVNHILAAGTKVGAGRNHS